MIDLLLQNIPPDAPQQVAQFVRQKEQELGGKLYLQICQKEIPLKGKLQKNVVVTIFCKKTDQTFPLPQFNNKPLSLVLKELKDIPQHFKIVFSFLPKFISNYLEKSGQKHQSPVKIWIYNEDTENGTETIIETRAGQNNEKATFAYFFEKLLNIDVKDLMQLLR